MKKAERTELTVSKILAALAGRLISKIKRSSILGWLIISMFQQKGFELTDEIERKGNTSTQKS